MTARARPSRARLPGSSLYARAVRPPSGTSPGRTSSRALLDARARRTGSRPEPGRSPRPAARSPPRSGAGPAAPRLSCELLERARAEDHRASPSAGRPARPARPAPSSTPRAAAIDSTASITSHVRSPCAAAVVGLDAALRVLAQPRGAGRAARRGVYLPVSQPPPSGDHGSSPSPVDSHGGHDLPLDLADEQVVLRLQRHRTRQAAELGEVDDLLDLPAGVVRQPDVARSCPARHGVVEEAERLLERRQRVEGVHLVEVDARRRRSRRSEASQRVAQVAAREPEVVRARRPSRSGPWWRARPGCGSRPAAWRASAR